MTMATRNPDGHASRRLLPQRTAGRATAPAALAALATALLLNAGAAAGYEVSGVSFDGLQRVDGQPLELTSLGLHRYKLVVKLYAMALYLDPGLRADGLSADEVLEPEVPKRLELETFWAIPAHIFRRMTREQIARAVSPDELERLSPSIEALNALYEDVEPGDRYAITYLPGRGTELAKNGVSKGVVEGETFARAMFGIWLGDQPFDRRLRSQLLEGQQ
jgi:hypothetical protein